VIATPAVTDAAEPDAKIIELAKRIDAGRLLSTLDASSLRESQKRLMFREQVCFGWAATSCARGLWHRNQNPEAHHRGALTGKSLILNGAKLRCGVSG
jgi:hypothetical protein